MNSLRIHWKTEWKLFLRGPLPWLLAASAGVLCRLVFSLERGDSSLYLLLQQFGFLYAGPLSIAALLTGIHGAQRDRPLKTDRILLALPYGSGSMTAVRYAVLTLPFVFLYMLPAGILISIGSSWLNPVSDLASPLAVYAVLSLSMAYAVALGWFLGTLLPRRISYVLGFLVWFVHVYAVLLIMGSILPDAWIALPNFLLLDVRSMGFWDESWGYFTDRFFWYHRGLYAALTFFLLLISIYLVKRRRREPELKLGTLPAAAICLAAAVFFLTSYVQVRGDRVADYHQWEHQITEQGRADTAGQTISVPVERYDLAVKYEAGLLKVRALLAMMKSGSGAPAEAMDFTLHPDFQVQSVTVNGKLADFHQEGYALTVAPKTPVSPGESVTLEVDYQGRVKAWRLIHPFGANTSKLVKAAFATSERVFLPGSYGWYPLPGRQALVRPDTGKFNVYSPWREVYPAMPPADYKLEADFPDTLPLWSNLAQTGKDAEDGRQRVRFEGTQTDGCALLGGPLQETDSPTSGMLRTVTGKLADPADAEEFLLRAENTVKQIDRILGIERSTPLLLFPADPSIERGGRNAGGFMTVQAGLFNMRKQDWGDGAGQFVSQYLQYLTGSKEEDVYWLGESMNAYLQSEGKTKPVRLNANYDSFGNKLENYLNEHDVQEAERMMRRMYLRLKEHPDQPLPVDEILQDREGG